MGPIFSIFFLTIFSSVVWSETDEEKLSDLHKIIAKLDILNLLSGNSTNLLSSIEDLPGIDKYSEFWETYEAPIEIKKEYPYYLAGYDAQNAPIWVQELGKWDIRKNVKMGGDRFKYFDRHMLQSLYRMIQSVNQSNSPHTPVTGFIHIADFDGFPIEQVTHVPTLVYFLKFMQRYNLIQDYLTRGFSVNTNPVALTVLNTIKPGLGQNVVDKIEIFGTNKEAFIPQLLKYIPKEVVPESYGGSTSFKPVKLYD